MQTSFRLTVLSAATLAALLSGCVSTAPTVGSKEASTVATGSAAGSTAENASTQLERCASPLGTAALVEETSAEWYRIFTTEYKLGSTTPVLRLLMQQSNCFVVVERGRAFQAMERERQIAGSGQARAGSNFGGGQMVAADYSITPEVLVSGRNTSGMGGGLAGLSRGLGVVGAIAGGIRTNEAATMLTLIDNRSGVQIAASQGASKNTDFSLGGALLGSGAGAGLGGYSNTPQGKVVVAAFTDAFNEMIRSLRNYKAQQVQGQGLGTGGKLQVDGAAAPAPAPAKPASKPATTTKSTKQSTTSSSTTAK
jgi:curli biogenesis system outer membrane secretion channel CsgG